MATSLSDLTNVMLSILREDSFSSAYPQTLMELLANSAQQDILAGRIIHPTTGEEAQKWDLNFNNWDAYFSNVWMTSLTADATIWATELDAITTNFPASWVLYIWEQIVTYTWVTGTQFTGVSGLLFPFVSGTHISIAFALPADFSSVKNIIYNGKFKLPAMQYDDVFESMNAYKWSMTQRNGTWNIYQSPYRVKPFYTIKDSAYLIIYQLNTTWENIHLRYEKLWATMTDVVDSAIPNDVYARTTIPYIAVADMMYERWEEARWDKVYNKWLKNIKKMYSFYNDASYEDQNWVNYGMQWGKRNI